MTSQDLEALVAQAASGAARPALAAAARQKRDKGIADFYYAKLLEAVLASDDADAIAWAAEALQVGDNLFKDVDMCAKFLRRADDLSGFMGSFLMGQMLLPGDRKRAYATLRKSARAGHIPSHALMQKIWFSGHPILGLILKPVVGLREGLRISSALNKPDAALRFWRHWDVFPDPTNLMGEKLKSILRSPFTDI